MPEEPTAAPTKAAKQAKAKAKPAAPKAAPTAPPKFRVFEWRTSFWQACEELPLEPGHFRIYGDPNVIKVEVIDDEE